MNKREIIDKEKYELNEDYSIRGIMEKIKDDMHLEQLIESINISLNNKILDLGSGSGYLSNAIASKFPNCSIVGLDISDKAISKARNYANKNNITNIDFISYDGVSFPFEDNSFHNVVTRYALHHFSNVESVISELNRIVKSGGEVIVSDPTVNQCDKVRFIDDFMKIKDDGHCKLYTKEEIIELFTKYGFKLKECFSTKFRFGSNRTKEFLEMRNNYDKSILDSYDIKVINEKVYITEEVLNISFIKI